MGIFEGDGGQNKVQIDVFDRNLVKEPDFDSLLVGALVLETTYRATPIKAGKAYQQPPAWLVEGLAERMRTRDAGFPPAFTPACSRTARRRAARVSRHAARAARRDFARHLPGAGRCPTGSRARVARRPLRPAGVSLAATPGGADELVAMFPSLGKNREALGRKWVLAMARASAANRVDLLSQRETADGLDRVLAVKALPDPKRPEVASMSGPYALPTIARSQSGKFILSQTEDGLLRLSLRAHPLYRSLVEEYLGIVRDLIRKPKSRQDKRIATAEQLRAGLNRQTSEARDYLDWVETTKIKTESPELTKAVEETQALEQAPPRNDAISRYLDAISERGQ